MFGALSTGGSTKNMWDTCPETGISAVIPNSIAMGFTVRIEGAGAQEVFVIRFEPVVVGAPWRFDRLRCRMRGVPRSSLDGGVCNVGLHRRLTPLLSSPGREPPPHLRGHLPLSGMRSLRLLARSHARCSAKFFDLTMLSRTPLRYAGGRETASLRSGYCPGSS